MMEKYLGKIESVSVGFGGYDDAMFGASFTLSFDGYVSQDFKGTWATHSESCKWTLEDQRETFGEVMYFLRDLCQQAKVKNVHDLKGKPIEVCLKGGATKSWRILTEVI